MSTDAQHRIMVAGMTVDVVRKPIKNLHLAVYPPDGRVRVAAPLAVDDDAVRLAVIDRLVWIKRQRSKFEGQPRQSRREMVRGESHYFLGKRYRLRVIERRGPADVVLRGGNSMDLYVRPGTTAEQRERFLQRWYRAQLRELVQPMLESWQAVLGVQVADWRIKRMKTRWGTCNADACRVWLNLELVKRSAACIEYVVVHELVHLMERRHGAAFMDLMDRHLPSWRLRKDELNSSPLAHATWTY